jgi:hypothetical protein
METTKGLVWYAYEVESLLVHLSLPYLSYNYVCAGTGMEYQRNLKLDWTIKPALIR